MGRRKCRRHRAHREQIEADGIFGDECRPCDCANSTCFQISVADHATLHLWSSCFSRTCWKIWRPSLWRRCSAGLSGLRSPKLVSASPLWETRWSHQANFRIDRDTSKCMFLVWFLDLKYAPRSLQSEGALQTHYTRRAGRLRSRRGLPRPGASCWRGIPSAPPWRWPRSLRRG